MEETILKPAFDDGQTAQELRAQRLKRFQDAMELRQPDRIPVNLPMSYMLAEYGGITKQELQENPDKALEILEKAALDFQPDAIAGVFGDPGASLALGERMTRWPGHGLAPDVQFQFVESEFMKAEDYDDFLEDLSDWGIRVYLPRAYSGLEGLSLLPPLGMALFGYYNLANLDILTEPRVAASLQAFARAAQATADAAAVTARIGRRMRELGFPAAPLFGSLLDAPYDFMSDTLRGMRGIMLDMMQRPDKLLAAEDKVARFQVKHAIAIGRKACFIPLHRGSDGFMSIPQFERFYWPQLKSMMLELIDHNITPVCFYEGAWDKRLSYLADLPRGKTVGWFQSTDTFKAKEVVGDTMCIVGGMPNALLASGTVDEVREHTRRLCQIVGKNGGFIMSTTIGEMSGSKPDLVKAWIDATREYGIY